MRIFILVLIFFMVSSPIFANPNQANPDWKEYKARHFIVVYHPSIPDQYVHTFAGKCEEYYSQLSEQIDLRRFDFWTWDNRAKVFIFPTRESYLCQRKRPKNSLASVEVRQKRIYTYYFSEDLLDTILPHEISHIMFRELIGLERQVPLQVEEAFAAQYENRAKL